MIVPDPNLRESIFTLQYHPFFTDVKDMCYSPYKIEANQCIDRVKLFDRHFDFLSTLMYDEFFDKLISWILSINDEYNSLSKRSYSLIIELIQKYIIEHPALHKSNYQLLTIVAIFCVPRFFEETPMVIEDLLFLTANGYTEKQFENFLIKFLKDINYDFMAPTQNDKISAYRHIYDQKIIDKALEILYISSPIREIYFHENIAEICILLGMNEREQVKSNLYKKYSSSLYDIKSRIKNYYKHNADETLSNIFGKKDISKI
jgi:hypothetical protein